MNFENDNYEFNSPNLFGNHQIENASTAISTALSIKDFKVSKANINRSLLNTVWPARMQNIRGKLARLAGEKFDIWLDGGHNLDASNVINNIIDSWEEKKIVVILGMINGKDPINFLRKIIDKISLLILLPINEHQYVMPYQIKSDVLEKFKPDFNINCCISIDEAIKVTKCEIPNGKILICGSLYLAGEVLKSDGYKIK